MPSYTTLKYKSAEKQRDTAAWKGEIERCEELLSTVSAVHKALKVSPLPETCQGSITSYLLSRYVVMAWCVKHMERKFQCSQRIFFTENLV
jgi:hypothetical protein